MKPEGIDIYETMVSVRDLTNLGLTDEQIREIAQGLDFYNLKYGIDIPCYQCGILTAMPFDELVDELGYSEEDILNLFVEFHLKIEGGKLSFQYNPKSPINNFLLKYKKDGYGWNVPSSIDATFAVVEREIRSDAPLMEDDDYEELDDEELDDEELGDED